MSTTPRMKPGSEPCNAKCGRMATRILKHDIQAVRWNGQRFEHDPSLELSHRNRRGWWALCDECFALIVAVVA